MGVYHQALETFVDFFCDVFDPHTVSAEDWRKCIHVLVKTLHDTPSEQEAVALGSLHVSDDAISYPPVELAPAISISQALRFRLQKESPHPFIWWPGARKRSSSLTRHVIGDSNRLSTNIEL